MFRDFWLSEILWTNSLLLLVPSNAPLNPNSTTTPPWTWYPSTSGPTPSTISVSVWELIHCVEMFIGYQKNKFLFTKLSFNFNLEPPFLQPATQTLTHLRQLVEDYLWWKMACDGSQTLIEDNRCWKTNFDGRQALMKDKLWWKATFGIRSSLIEDHLW